MCGAESPLGRATPATDPSGTDARPTGLLPHRRRTVPAPASLRSRFAEVFANLLPDQQRVNGRERLRAAFGALCALLLTALIGRAAVGADPALPWIIAPMGASAVLLFAVPASPLAQPWAMLGGNLLAGAIGVTCAKLIPDLAMAAPVAVAVSIGLMFALRCIHPPAGAVALTAVIGGPAIRDLGFGFLLNPLLVNTVSLLALAVVYNRATGRSYPHVKSPAPGPTATTLSHHGVSEADLDAVLDDYNQVIDISRDDLRELFMRAEAHAFRRRFGTVRCADMMTREVITVESATPLDAAWAQMRRHRIKALPVIDNGRRVIGILTQADLMRNADLGRHRPLGERVRDFLRRGPLINPHASGTVGRVMTTPAQTATEDTPVIELIALLGGAGHSHIPIVDNDNRLTGIVAPRDLISELYQGRLTAAR